MSTDNSKYRVLTLKQFKYKKEIWSSKQIDIIMVKRPL